MQQQITRKKIVPMLMHLAGMRTFSSAAMPPAVRTGVGWQLISKNQKRITVSFSRREVGKLEKPDKSAVL